MTHLNEVDTLPSNPAKTIPLLLESSASELAGIRVTRAEFARLMGCSKQAVTDWVKAGRITVGADERFDPRKAVAQLLRTGDPKRLRSRVLAPLVRDISIKDMRIADLEARLSRVEEDGEFHEDACGELNLILQVLPSQLEFEWPKLQTMPASEVAAALQAWIELATCYGLNDVKLIAKAGRLDVSAGTQESRSGDDA